MTTNKNVIQKDTSTIPRFVPIAIVLLSVSLLSLLLVQRFAPPSARAGSAGFVQATQAFTPGQAMTISDENITVYVPKDSVNLPGTISIVSREPNLFPAAAQPSWTRPQIIEVLFLNTQGTPAPNIIFSNAVRVCFKITPQQWEDFTKLPDAYQIQYYAVENHPPVWQTLPMTPYSDTSMLCGQTMHFSIFALAIQMDTGLPVTGLTATATSTLPGARRPPIRTDDSPEATNPSAPVPASTSPAPAATQAPATLPPQPTDIMPAPTESPAPTEPPPTDPPAVTETAPPSGFPIPLPTLPTLPIGP